MRAWAQPDPEELLIVRSRLDFPVVGIGASTGGLGALQRFLAAVPDDIGMAFVVVTHLPSDAEGELGPLLRQAGRLPVATVRETTDIEANRVYVIPTEVRLVMTDGLLRVSAMNTPEGRAQSIDLFFRSLAEAHRERAICVVLSGSGSDGAQGLKRVRELGGVAAAQSPEDAEFDAMPRAAIDTGSVDLVLPAEDMPQRFLTLWKNARAIELPAPPADLKVEPAAAEAGRRGEDALLSIMALLRERTGHDFGHYQRATVLRRLERRMQVSAMPDLPSYRRMLDARPAETQALLQDMLNSVSNFFRDPEAFAALAEAVRSQWHGRAPNEPFRAWVAGCATGEEACSIAILLREVFDPPATTIQVFASDIDHRAIDSARRGEFPGSIEVDVSPDRLRSFFNAEPAGFSLQKQLRDSVVFSVHDLLNDPPFTRMDLVCCRNLLACLDREAQARVFDHLHFALRPGGLLFLGSTETADGAADGLFEPLDTPHRIYVPRPRRPPSLLHPAPRLRIPLRVPAPEPATAAAPLRDARAPLELLHERVLRRHAPPNVLVDADLTVLHVGDRTDHLLRLPEGAPTARLLALVRPELRAELHAALSLAREAQQTVESPRVRLLVNGESRVVTMTVSPVADQAPGGLLLVVFNEAQRTLAASDGDAPTDRDPVVGSLERELVTTQALLHRTVGESAASTQALRASNDQLQAINEELETSREELHSLNEELSTVNAELTLRIEDAAKLADDLQNLITSAELGSLFVDRGMRVMRFTPQAATLFNLRDADVGRPLDHVTHRLAYPQLADDVDLVLRELRRVEREVASDDGRWFLARALPYRTNADHIEGAVLAFFDITARRAAEDELRNSLQRMQLAAQSMRDHAIITLDPDGIVVTWSAGAERVFGYTGSEMIGRSFDLLFTAEDRAAGKPAEELGRAREAGRADDDRWHVTKAGALVFCSGITSPVNDGTFVGFAKITRDFTNEELREQKLAALSDERAGRAALRDDESMKDQFLAVVSHELKNPLSLIQMNAQLLERLPAFAADERVAQLARAILAAVSSQVQIINDLLELSRANLQKVTLAPSLVDLAELVGQVVDAVRPDAGAKNLALATELAPVRVLADRGRVEQVVWNLVTNAIKFTPPGGRVQVSVDTDRAMARLSVSDSGIGIAPEHLDSIFEMFRQVDARPSRLTEGLGIGLALVKQLTELHGGRVHAQSDGLNAGARFSVWLPLALGEALPLPVATHRHGLVGLHMLIVDDQPALLMAFSMLLESEGALVSVAEGAVPGLEAARSQPFDVVVSDIAMPGADGYWFAEQLRAEPGTRNVALIAVSGMSRESDRAKALQAGFDAHLAKPLNIDSLRAAVTRALGRRRAGAVAGA